VTPPVWLIAGREFRAYAATLSFWIALAVGPLVLAGALALATVASSPAAPATAAVVADDPALARSAAAALVDAARIEGRGVTLVAENAGPRMRLAVTTDTNGAIAVRFAGAPLLSPAGQALVARTMERDAALRRLGAGAPAVVSWSVAMPPPGQAPDAGAISRFSLVMMLWLTLTGSLGMLLQAVVRERANRALESLLAAARPWEIVFGKLIGVGAVSGLVLGAWLGSAAALAPLTPGAGGLIALVLRGMAQPGLILRAGLIYLLAYAFYGLVTVAVGAAARDTAGAQTLSRPMFAVLLAAFFAALTAAAGGAGARLAWLVYAPPFTPFMLLLRAPGEIPLGQQLAALTLLALAAAAAAVWAVRTLTVQSGSQIRFHPERA
jgi:ABC-2 type transport system permease protein